MQTADESAQKPLPPGSRYLIALGANLGDRDAYLDRAIAAIGTNLGGVERVASRYETAPIGAADRLFLNSALIARSDLDPEAAMQALLAIEAALGRVRLGLGANRVIDLDLILWRPGTSDVTRSHSGPHATLPHPRTLERDFVLVPAAEIAPRWRLPTGDQSLADIVLARGYFLAPRSPV